MNKRKFVRYKFKKHLQYRKVNLANDKVIESKLIIAISKDLSNSGMLITTEYPPEISCLIEIPMETNPITKVLGKVVRVEDIGNGQYDVGIAFIKDSHGVAQEVEYLTAHAKKHQATFYIMRSLIVFFIILIAFCAYFVHSQYSKLYVPGDRFITLTPTSIDLPYEDVYFKTADGETINGWFIPAENAKATFLYCHGNEGNLTDRLSRINFFHKMKMNVFIFDYRGYGKSSGKPSEQGLYKDAQAAYDYMVRKKEIDKNSIVILGVSMGGAVATDLCLNRKAKALILESTIVSLQTQAQDLYPFLPIKLFVHDEFDTISKMRNIHIPKLITHGIDDEVVSFKHARFLFDDAPPPKKFLPFHGGHSDDVYKISDTYKDELYQFLHENKVIDSIPADSSHKK
jgi:fermentation-respiration switch protein FrsA (DUF1100 family)